MLFISCVTSVILIILAIINMIFINFSSSRFINENIFFILLFTNILLEFIICIILLWFFSTPLQLYGLCCNKLYISFISCKKENENEMDPCNIKDTNELNWLLGSTAEINSYDKKEAPKELIEDIINRLNSYNHK